MNTKPRLQPAGGASSTTHTATSSDAYVLTPNVAQQLLERIVPPGTSHLTLVEEIHARGYEVFVGGATVLDVITGRSTLDAELVTTMPLGRLHTLATSMYGADQVRMMRYHRLAGHLQVGRTDGTTGPLLDVRLFRHFGSLGSPDVIFGAEFMRDVSYGDFTCGALYYDPINKVLVDPTGAGIADAENKLLRPAYDIQQRDPRDVARVGLHTIRLKLRDFSIVPEFRDSVIEIIRKLPALTYEQQAAYIEADVLCDVAADDRVTVLDQMREFFAEFGAESVFDQCVKPHEGRLCSVSR